MSVVALARSEMSFSDRISRLLERVDYRVAITDEDKDRIYSLRYDAYLREGAVDPNFAKRLSDRYDDLDNAWVFGVFVDGQLASSVRLNIASPAYPDFPGVKVFTDELGPEIEAGRTIVDPTRFVVEKTFARLHPEMPYVTLRIAHMAAEYFDADVVLATVRTEHQAFYKRVFGHAPMGEPKAYPGLTTPISLMMLDYPAERERILRRYPFFRSTYFERRMLFSVPGVAEPWASREVAVGARSGSYTSTEVAAAL